MPKTNDQYVNDCQRTLSDKFHPELLQGDVFLQVCAELLVNGVNLDLMKKALFYGKQIHAPFHEVDSCAAAFSGFNSVVLHGIIGKVTESLELLESVLVAIAEEKPLDLVNIKEEVGDGFWYDAILAKACGFTFEEAQQANIAKLKARYPEKFTSELAENRNLKTERQILQAAQKHANENPMLLASEKVYCFVEIFGNTGSGKELVKAKLEECFPNISATILEK